MSEGRYWIAVVDDAAVRDLARGRWTALATGGSDARPARGDRVDILAVRRPPSVRTARFVANVDVRGTDADELETRHRFVAPAPHEPSLTSLGTLIVSVGWTDAILAGLVGGILPIGARDHARIDRALRDAALAFGPAPSRPHHRRPRTPGRRALLEGCAAWRPARPPR